MEKITKKTVKDLRKDFPIFCYESYKWSFAEKDLKISFKFKAGKNIFNPTLKIKNIPIKAKKLEKEIIDNLVFNLGMIESFSYWKAFCSPEIVVSAGSLNADQTNWWEKLLINGMGQYFFENKINFKIKNFVKIVSENKSKQKIKLFKTTKKEILLPIGGGKDSAVSLQLLNRYKKDISCFLLNPSLAAERMAERSGCKVIVCERKLDPLLLELNRKGYLNGHTPFVAYLSFVSTLVSAVFNKKYIILSNEKSSNEGNIVYLGEEINHQYSKTYEFENRFRSYVKKYLEDVEYFSLLRPLYELQIAKIFAEFKDYFPVFVSCNEAEKTCSGTKKKTGEWCGVCSKCLFVYMILYPFTSVTELKKIFKEDLFNKKELLPMMLDLITEDKEKPWECVGTKKESLIALYLSWKKNLIKDLEQPLLLQYFVEEIMPKSRDWEKEAKKIMENWDIKNNLPKGFDYKKIFFELGK
jgi:hypothetical protein